MSEPPATGRSQDSATTGPPVWYERSERGSSLGIRIMVGLYRALGRPLARILLHPIIAYFVLFGGEGRRASRRYFEHLYGTANGARALGHRPTWRDSYRHIYEFASVILDRVGFWLGREDDFEIEVHGMSELDRVAEEGRGGIFLGSHLGSFDVLRLLAQERSPIPVNVLMYTEHAERINDILRSLPRARERSGRARVIQVLPGSFEHVLEVRKRIRDGEVVAILADRVHLNEEDRAVQVDFLDGRARLPAGPFLLAGALGCPVLLITGLRTGAGCYEVFVERFADRIEMPRAQRTEVVARSAQSYADRLAEHVLRAPHQWFNFFDYWIQEPGSRSE